MIKLKVIDINEISSLITVYDLSVLYVIGFGSITSKEAHQKLKDASEGYVRNLDRTERSIEKLITFDLLRVVHTEAHREEFELTKLAHKTMVIVSPTEAQEVSDDVKAFIEDMTY